MAFSTQKTKQAVKEAESTFSEFVDEAAETAKKGAANVGAAVEDLPEKAGSVASKAAEKAREAASYVGDKAEQATGAVGAGMESLGGAIREHTPDEGVLGKTGDAVADKLESGGRYLEEQGLHGMAEDVTNLIRRNPIPALLVGVGVGFLLARIARS